MKRFTTSLFALILIVTATTVRAEENSHRFSGTFHYANHGDLIGEEPGDPRFGTNGFGSSFRFGKQYSKWMRGDLRMSYIFYPSSINQDGNTVTGHMGTIGGSGSVYLLGGLWPSVEPYLYLEVNGAIANLGAGIYGGTGSGIEFRLPMDLYMFGEFGLNSVFLFGNNPVLGAELMGRGGIGYRF